MQQPFQPLLLDKSPRYREAAYAAIKEAILNRQLDPHQPLIEEKVAASLAISRTPVREALAILEHEQLIAPRNGRGLYVRELSHDEFVALFVANETVEPYLARQAARLATRDQLVAIGEAIARGKQAAVERDIAGSLRSGRDFHRLVGIASGNEPLTQFVARGEERVDLYLMSYEKVVDEAGMHASNREHEAIFHAIAENDPEAAARLVIYHSQSVRERFADLFRSSQAEPTLMVSVN